MARVLGSGAFPHFRLQAWAAGATVFALLFSGGYTVSRVMSEYRHHEDALVRFGAAARSVAAQQGWALELVQPVEGGLDEGMLLYLRKVRALKKDKALEAWQRGEIDALAIESRTLRQMEKVLAPFEVLLTSERRGDGRTYDLIKKSAQ